MQRIADSLIRLVRNRLQRREKTRRAILSTGRQLSVEPLEGRRVLATVTAFSPTNSGFNVELSEQINTANLNLYDTQNQAAGAADVTLRGASVGDVKGSLIVEGTNLRFIATGGVLAPDTYTVTLRSAANSFTDLADGGLLDGEFNGVFPSGNGVPGGDFVTTFAVTAAPGLIVSIPDFARGPGQQAQGPGSGSGSSAASGLPIRLSNAAGVTSATFTLQYDPDLLDLSSISLAPNAPAGSQVESNLTVPGSATISFFVLAPLGAGQLDILTIQATVPEDATYGDAQAIRFTSFEVNAGALSARSDDAVHIVAYPGDTNANRRYDAEDARLIARVGVGLDSGFVFSDPVNAGAANAVRLFPTIDPLIIGDVTNVDGLSPLDASDVLRRVVGLPTPNIPAIPSIQSPTDIALSSTAVLSNLPIGTTVGTFSTTDPDSGDTHTYSLVAGTGDTDNASFTISGNSLRTAAVFDASVKSSYSVRVQTTDSSGRNFQKSFVITVTEVNVAPTSISLSNSTVPENATSGTAIGSLTTVDNNPNDTHAYSIVSVDGAVGDGPFAISGSSLQVAGTLDFETKSSFVVVVRSVDQGGLSVNQTFTINVSNVNEAPNAIALSDSTLTNNAPAGTVVGSLSTTDPDASDTHTYTLVTGTGATDNASFAIVGNELRSATSIDFSTQTSYSVRVRSTDAAGLFTEQLFTITREGQNSAPTSVALTPSSIAENASIGTAIGTLSTTDVDTTDTHTYALVAGSGDTDNASFTISGGQLLTAASFDFETKSSYSVRVRSTDNGGLSTEQVLTVTVTNVNEVPSAITLSVSTLANEAPAETVVGSLSTSDPDASDTHTYTLVTGTGATDNASFAIVGNELRSATSIDFSTQTSYSVRVRSTDAAGLFTEQLFTITREGQNSAPTAVALTPSSVAENTVSGTAIGTLSTTDVDTTDTHTYALVVGTGDTDNASFTISGNQLLSAAIFDFETKSNYSVRVRSTDNGGLTTEQVLTVNVTNVNEVPSAITLSDSTLTNNAPVGTVVGSLSTTDPDASDTHTYTLVTGTGSMDNASFAIVGNELRSATSIDFSTQTSYSVVVRSVDQGGLSINQTFTVNVTNVNEAPSAITLSDSTLTNNAPVGTVVGSLSTTDPDASDTHTYILVTGTGSMDNGSFAIVGNELRSATSIDFSTQTSYSVRVRSTDAAGLFTEQLFTITREGQNSAPTSVALTPSSIAENASIGTAIGTLSTTDVDTTDTHTYALVAGSGDTDNASFTISGSQLLTAASFDFETKSSYSVLVRSTDNGGLSTEQVLTVDVTNVNEAATVVSLSENTVVNGQPIGTTVGTFSNDDPDASDSFSYGLVAGEGDTDNTLFTINGDQLVTAFIADQVVKDTYSIRVNVTDAAGLSAQRTFTISVVAPSENVAPTAMTISGVSLLEDSPALTAIGIFATTDANASDFHVYTLVAGDGDADNASFTIDGDELQSLVSFDFETQPTATIRVRTTDPEGLFFEQAFVITIAKTNLPPTSLALAGNTVAENLPDGTAVGTLSTVDSDSGDTFTYSLVSGDGDADNESFVISGDQLLTATSFDFETKSSYSIRVRSTDSGGLSTEQSLAIVVTNVNEAATAITLNANKVPHGQPSGTVVGSFGSNDPDDSDTFNYSFAAGDGDADNGSFTITAGQLATAFIADQDLQASYSVRVSVVDGGGLSTEQSFTINITDAVVNVAPIALSLSAASLAENAAPGTLVGLFTTIDANVNDTHVYSLVSGDGDTDNTSFAIVDNQLRASVPFDFETQPTATIRVRTTDPEGLFFEQAFTIAITDINEIPLSIALGNNTVQENVAIESLVGTLATVDSDAGSTFTYTLVSGTGDTDNASFVISDNQLRTAANLDFETKSAYSVRVQSTDNGGLSTEQILTINVQDVNEAPTALELDADSVDENMASGTTVGSFASIDPDLDDTHIYSLVGGLGDDDNASFTLSGNSLLTAESFDFESQSTYTIRVRTTDAGSLSFERSVIINVNDVNDAPELLSLSPNTIESGSFNGTVVGSFVIDDADIGDSATYSLVSGEGDTDNNSFTIFSEQLAIAFDADIATKDSYSVRVRVTDLGGLFSEQTLTVNVIEANTSPTALQLSPSTILETVPVGTVVGTFNTADANTVDSHTYSLATGSGDTDNASFTINGNNLLTAVLFDFESKSEYRIRVRTTDVGGLTLEQELVIAITDVN